MNKEKEDFIKEATAVQYVLYWKVSVRGFRGASGTVKVANAYNELEAKESAYEHLVSRMGLGAL